MLFSMFLFYSLIHQSCSNLTDSESIVYAKNNACKGMIILSQYTHSTTTTQSKIACSFKCSMDEECLSFYFEESSLTCHLNNQSSTSDCLTMTPNTDAKHFDKIKPRCLNGGHDVDGTCECVGGFIGSLCERLMTDCTEEYKSGYTYKNGVYNIQPPFSAMSFPVYCVMRYGGRTIVQMRKGATEIFYRNWTDYRDGFGSLESDFWLGLEKMYQIVRNRNFEFRISMRLANRSYYQQRYKEFNLSDETNGYAMYFASSVGKTRDRVLGDSLSTLKHSKFSTPDVDNDQWTAGSCAQQFESGFWFNACADCNPNGRLLKPKNGKRTNVDSEVFWTYNLADNVPHRLKFYLFRK